MTGNIDDNMKKLYTLLSIEESLMHTKLSQFCQNMQNAWSNHLFVTQDYQTVLNSPSRACDDFLRPVWWLAHIKNPHGIKSSHILVLLSSYECDRLLPIFRNSSNATLCVYRPRLSKLHSNLIHNEKLRATDVKETVTIKIQDEVQFEVYSGAMYFKSEAEQTAYCGFLGLIPRPRTQEQQSALEELNIIESKGFVPPRMRQSSTAISNCVGQCNFQENPVDLALKIIEAHHQSVPKESHVSSILELGIKASIENVNG